MGRKILGSFETNVIMADGIRRSVRGGCRAFAAGRDDLKAPGR